MKTHYIVEIFTNNEWIWHSWHRNYDYAVANADVVFTAGYPSRIVLDGKIVYQRVESEP